MGKLKSSFALKAAVFVLALALLTGAALSGIAVGGLYALGAYDGCSTLEKSEEHTSFIRDSAVNAVYNTLEATYGGSTELRDEYADSVYYPPTTNLRFEVYDAKGERQFGNIRDEESLVCTGSEQFSYMEAEYSLSYGLKEGLPARDIFRACGTLLTELYPRRDALIFICAGMLLFGVAAVCFLCSAAGHKKAGEAVQETFSARFPVEFTLAALAAAAVCIVILPVLLLDQSATLNSAQLYLCLLGWVSALALLIAAITNLARRLKLKGWYRRSLVFIAVNFLWRAVKALGRALRGALRLLPQEWLAALVATALLALFSFLAIVGLPMGSGFAVILWVALAAALVLCVCMASRDFRRLGEAAADVAAGDLERKTDTSRMRGPLKKMGDDLNRIGEGLAAAVEQRTKSERLRTELITNVSHDLKTPLTSIINYAGLLAAEPLEDKAASYAEVLGRQAQRLKKLTEDIVEASKASTGNIAVELLPTDLGELVQQAVGEYSDRLAECGLTPVLELPEEKLSVTADGRLLWRVFDNLLSNACKYALTGTRIYISAQKGAGCATAEFKNISRDQLNVPADELMERFVRGDRSRTDGGSGLGLNIAKSLAEMQGGGLELEVDGDLFKAVVSMPLCKEGLK